MKSILIADSNQILSENFARILSPEYKIYTTNSAEDAVQKIDSQMPSAILADVLLDGHSIFALLNELQSYPDTAKIPVVICTDFTNFLDLESLKKYGVVAILDKSKMLPSDILRQIRRAIEAN